VHIYALGINFCKVGKDRREDERVFFSYFTKKNKDEKIE
jgi:hypothetical protein